MTYDELASAKPVIEIDDIHNAKTVIGETLGLLPEFRMLRIAEMLAATREHYVKVGREIEAAQSPPGSCGKCTAIERCRSVGECIGTGYPFRKPA